MTNLLYVMPQVGYQLDSVQADELMPVLNMLNTRYVVMLTDDERLAPMLNHQAFGNAWMVKQVNYVGSASEELSALHQTDLRHVAVADKQFQQTLGQSVVQDSTTQVRLDSYAPNHLSYTVNSKAGGVVVFSEIYYPDWTATIDGKPAELGRVNYVLRALHIDGGQHKVELDFHPQTVSTTEAIAYVALAILALLIVAVVVLGVLRQKKKTA